MRSDGTLQFAAGKMFAVGQPFYTHPQPKREWQGLTDEDMEELSSAWWKPNENEMALIDWVEAKLEGEKHMIEILITVGVLAFGAIIGFAALL